MAAVMYAGLAARDAAVPEWLKRVRPGDVLRTSTGKLRVVRSVRYRRGVISSCSFTIKHCSWTGACWTTKQRSELFGWSPTGKRVSLRKRIDRDIARDLRKPGPERKLTCCSVVGVA
jgi:hypothetical protein